jgi:hypothetical protein
MLYLYSVAVVQSPMYRVCRAVSNTPGWHINYLYFVAVVQNPMYRVCRAVSNTPGWHITYLYFVAAVQSPMYRVCRAVSNTPGWHSGLPCSRTDESGGHPPDVADARRNATSSYACSTCESQTDPR